MTIYAQIEEEEVLDIIIPPSEPSYDGNDLVDFTDPAAVEAWAERHGYLAVVEVARPEDTEGVRHTLHYEVIDGAPTQVWTARNASDRMTLLGDILIEHWNDAERIYTRFTRTGVPYTSLTPGDPNPRSYTPEEIAELEGRVADEALASLDLRLRRIEEFLWPPEPTPDPGTPLTGVPTFEDLEGIWPDQRLLAENGKVWKNVSGVPLTSPPSAFPGARNFWTHLFIEVASLGGEENPPDPDPDPPTHPEGYVGTWSATAEYAVGNVVDHDGLYYRCKVAHGAEYMGTWRPDLTVGSVWDIVGPVTTPALLRRSNR